MKAFQLVAFYPERDIKVMISEHSNHQKMSRYIAEMAKRNTPYMVLWHFDEVLEVQPFNMKREDMEQLVDEYIN